VNCFTQYSLDGATGDVRSSPHQWHLVNQSQWLISVPKVGEIFQRSLVIEGVFTQLQKTYLPFFEVRTIFGNTRLFSENCGPRLLMFLRKLLPDKVWTRCQSVSGKCQLGSEGNEEVRTSFIKPPITDKIYS